MRTVSTSKAPSGSDQHCDDQQDAQVDAQGRNQDGFRGLTAGRWPLLTSFWWCANARPPSFAMTSTRFISVSTAAKQGLVNHAAVADEEVWEAHVALTVHHRGVVMVDAVWEIWCRSKVTVADVQVTQAFDVLVIVNAVVSCLAGFEAIGKRSFPQPYRFQRHRMRRKSGNRQTQCR